MVKGNKPKVLLWDIESSHNLLLSFGLREEFVPHQNIITERYIFCISYKWYGQKKIHTISILDDHKRFKKDKHDDYYVVTEFYKIISKADAHVAHYGDNFDIKMFKGRLLANGLRPLPKIKSFDTCKIARRYFKFNSNKLDYLAQLMGYKGKMENPKNLWIDCFNGDEKALKHMAKYNRVDIDILEYVFKKLMPHVENHRLNINMFLKGMRCPNLTCGSMDISWQGYNFTRTNKFRRFRCSDCGGWSDERKGVKMDIKIK